MMNRDREQYENDTGTQHQQVYRVTVEETYVILKEMAEKMKEMRIKDIYGVPRGGLVVAVMLSNMTGLPLTTRKISEHTLVVDDLVETGGTLSTYGRCKMMVMFAKQRIPHVHAMRHVSPDTWLEFFWEAE